MSTGFLMGSFQVLEVFDLIDYDEFHLPKSNTNDDQGQNFTIIQIFWIYAPTNQNMELYDKRTL